MKKLFTILALLLATLAAQAATYYGFKIAGVSVNSDNYQNVTGSNIASGTVKYDPSSNTVTLTNVTISRTGSNNRAILNESNSGLTVKLVGTNNLSATQSAPVRFEKNTTLTVSSGTTTITGGSEGGIYISGAYDLTINGPGTLNISATSKGGIEGSNDNNSVSFFNVNATIYGGGGDLLDISNVLFYNSVNPSTAPKTVTLKSISSTQPNVENVSSMGFSPNVVIQQPVGANFNSSSKSIANYDYTNNAFLSDVKGTDIVISDKDVVADFSIDNFPDANFRDYLAQKFRKRFITTTDVANTTWLSPTALGISNLKGVEYFTALTDLSCKQNNLTTFDVSALTALTELRCEDNPLTTLDVSHNPNLKLLYCYNTSLTTLNLANNTKMEDLWLEDNYISGSGAAQFVESLPTRTGAMLSFKFMDRYEKGNELTVEQVQAARAKGWNPQRLNPVNTVYEDYWGVVYVNATNFPDANFRSAISDTDTDSNGKLDQDEWKAVTELNVGNQNISSLVGIKYFTELTSLNVNQNNLGTLNLNKNTKLTFLSCANNQLTNLYVAGCTQLQTLLCSANQLRQLDLTPNAALSRLSCEANKLTSLRVSTGAIPAGVYGNLYVFSNQLGSEAVDQFIASLDNRPTRKSYYIFTTGGDDQKMTMAQVQQSRAKGWWPMLLTDGTLTEYEVAEEYPITIAGTVVTSANKDGVAGDGITGTITYDPEANVLTLTNVTITSDNTPIKVDRALPGIKIVLRGNNTINCTRNTGMTAVWVANCDGAVIEGPGRLTVNNSGAALWIGSGSGSGDHRMTIRNCTIVATARSGGGSTAISEDDGDANLTIDNATVRLEHGYINCGYDLQLVGCHITLPEGGYVDRGDVCAPGVSGAYTGYIAIEPILKSSGDVNGDGKADVTDVNQIINIMLGKAENNAAADVNGDGKIDVTDVNQVINIMLGKASADVTTTYTVNGVSFKMVQVEGGTFTMGAVTGPANQTPAHQVTLSSYSIGQTEVTQELWLAVMGTNPSRYTGNLQRPVESVTWDDCQAFINRLNELTGMAFRFPTEAEWEYAARGGKRTKGYTYAGSNNVDDVAWYLDNIPNYSTQTVATKAPNELGLYDMNGNVIEWCQDYGYYYTEDAQINPVCTSSDYEPERMYRGGCYSDQANWFSVVYRNWMVPTRVDGRNGLRLAL